MKVIKIVLSTLIILSLFIISGIFIYFWPIDPRLNGTFQSDVQETMEYLHSQEYGQELNWDCFEQMLGHIIFEHNGHLAKVLYQSYTMKGCGGNNPGRDKDSVGKVFIFMKRSDINKERITMIAIPYRFWQTDEITFPTIEFSSNGFWLVNSDWISNYKEKFTRL